MELWLWGFFSYRAWDLGIDLEGLGFSKGLGF